MSHPLIKKIQKCKSIDEIIALIDNNKKDVNESLLETFFNDIIAYKNMGNIQAAFDFVRLYLYCAELIQNVHYIAHAKILQSDLLCVINKYKDSLELCNSIKKDYILKEDLEAELFIVEGNINYFGYKNYDDALKKYLKSKKIFKKIKNNNKYYIVKLNIARVFVDKNNSVKAEKICNSCIEYFGSIGENGLLGLAASFEIKGKSMRVRNYAMCISLLDKSYNLFLEIKAPLRAFTVKLSLLEIYLDFNYVEKIHAEYDELIETLTKLNMPLFIARLDWNRGKAFVIDNKLDCALRYIEKAKIIFREYEILPDLARILRNEADIKRLKKDYDGAMDLYIESKSIFLENNMDYDASVNDLLLAFTKFLNKDDKEEILKLSFYALKKGYEYNDYAIIYSSSELIGSIFAINNNLIEAVGFLSNAVDEINNVRRQINQEIFKIKFLMNKQITFEKLILNYIHLNLFEDALDYADKSKFQTMLDIMYNEEELNINQSNLIDKIKNVLDNETIIIYYYVTKVNIVIFLISKYIFKTISKTIKEDDLRDLVYTHISKIDNFESSIDDELYNVIFPPIENRLSNYKRIYVIPHKFLHSLPFCTLYKNGKYLIENYQIISIPNLYLLLTFLEKTEKPKESLLALGNPERNLDEAEKESIEISKLFDNKKILLRSDASKAAFYKYINEYDILHLACHGIFNSEKPQESALLLADGPLKAMELFYLNIKTGLVSISACKSGKVSIEPGDELIGLIRAFLSSGIQTIVASYWDVTEEPSFTFITSFFEKINEMCVSEAFQHAQLKVKEAYPAPFLWAPFYLIGDFR